MYDTWCEITNYSMAKQLYNFSNHSSDYFCWTLTKLKIDIELYSFTVIIYLYNICSLFYKVINFKNIC